MTMHIVVFTFTLINRKHNPYEVKDQMHAFENQHFPSLLLNLEASSTRDCPFYAHLHVCNMTSCNLYKVHVKS